jgi:hypothetical protein
MAISTRLRAHLRSNAVGYVALFIALSGTAWAAGTIGSNDIKNNAINSKHIKNGEVRNADHHVPMTLSGTFDNIADPPPGKPGATLTVRNNGTGRGIRVTGAGSYGIEVGNITGADGIRVNDTTDDGIQMGNAPDYPSYGFYIPSPGVSTYGLWPNTANTSGEWALFTVDNIEAGNVAAAAFTAVAKASGATSLRPGDVAEAGGLAAPLPGATSRLPRVERADAAGAVVGVVESRMELRRPPGKREQALESAPGPARAGDYVALTVLGVADVRVAGTGAISAGEPLAATSGAAAARRTTKVNGITVAEEAPTVGIALAAPDSQRGTVPVFVSPR